MSDRILVAYATKYGSTREVAEAGRAALLEDGVAVDIKPAKEVVSLEGFKGVVLASPIYFGTILKEAKDFLERHDSSLRDRPLALLSCGPAKKAELPGSLGQLDAVLAGMASLKPVATAMFAGKIDPGRFKLGDRLLTLLPASPLHGVRKNDERDWDAIRAWAKKLPTALGLA